MTGQCDVQATMVTGTTRNKDAWASPLVAGVGFRCAGAVTLQMA